MSERTLQERLRGKAMYSIPLTLADALEAADRIDELEKALAPFAGPEEISEAETAVPNNSPVTIRCQLGDVRRTRTALHPKGEQK